MGHLAVLSVMGLLNNEVKEKDKEKGMGIWFLSKDMCESHL